MSAKTPQMEVTATAPDFALKKKLEDVSIRDVFTDESIAEADAVIEESKKDFFGDAASKLEEMETAYTQAEANAKSNKKPVKAIERAAHSLKGQSETLGFDLLAHISKSLYGFCNDNFRTGEDEQIIVLRKHLDALQLIIRDKMQGDGGDIGKALIQSLQQLNKKYA